MKSKPHRVPQTVLPIDGCREESPREKHARGRVVYEEQVLPAFRGAVERVSGKECTGLFDTAPSTLSSALSTSDETRETARKYVQLEWLVQLLLHAPDGVKLELLSKLCGLAGYRPPERKRKLSAAERAERRWDELKRLAPGLLPMIDSAIDAELEDEE
jgi:hypothetical protein